jgi:hypothetical protein
MVPIGFCLCKFVKEKQSKQLTGAFKTRTKHKTNEKLGCKKWAFSKQTKTQIKNLSNQRGGLVAVLGNRCELVRLTSTIARARRFRVEEEGVTAAVEATSGRLPGIAILT